MCRAPHDDPDDRVHCRRKRRVCQLVALRRWLRPESSASGVGGRPRPSHADECAAERLERTGRLTRFVARCRLFEAHETPLASCLRGRSLQASAAEALAHGGSSLLIGQNGTGTCARGAASVQTQRAQSLPVTPWHCTSGGSARSRTVSVPNPKSQFSYVAIFPQFVIASRVIAP